MIQVSSSMHAPCGWDVFSLDYHVDVPLNTVLTPEVMNKYLKIFNFLWRMKRVEHSLSSTWRKHMNLAHNIKDIPDLAADLRKFYKLRNEMIHFIYNLQYYMMFEVLECSWQELVLDMKSASDLDQLVAAHAKYLNTIMGKSLLTSDALLNDLTTLLDLAIKFCRAQESLYLFAMEEATRRMKRTRKSEVDQSPFLSSSLSFHTMVELRSQLNGIAQDYDTLFGSFVASLVRQKDENLKFLRFRYVPVCTPTHRY